MTQAIWKYSFEITDYFELPLPFGAKVLLVEMQGEQPCIWAMVEASNTPEARTFSVVGTGHPLPNGEYIGTFQQPPFVWHLFETAPLPPTEREE